MNIQSSHLAYAAGMAIHIAIRLFFQHRVASEKKSISRAGRSDLGLVVLLVVTQVGLPLIFLLTPWINWANYTLPRIIPGAGALVMGSSLWLFWRSHADLGNSWSITLELNQDHRLITQGVYRLVRHPMYASFFLFAFSQGLLLSNWFAGWAAMVSVSLLCGIRLPREEQMMLEYFGEEYRAYMQRTGGIIPRFHAAHEEKGVKL